MKSEKTKIDEAVECIAEATKKQCKRIIELETELSVLNNEITKEKSLSQSYEAIIQSLTKDNDKLRNNTESTEIAGLQKQIESYAEDIASLNSKLAAANKRAAEDVEYIVKLKKKIDDLENSMKNYSEIDKIFKGLNAKNKAYQNFIYSMMLIELKGDIDNE